MIINAYIYLVIIGIVLYIGWGLILFAHDIIEGILYLMRDAFINLFYNPVRFCLSFLFSKFRQFLGHIFQVINK